MDWDAELEAEAEDELVCVLLAVADNDWDGVPVDVTEGVGTCKRKVGMQAEQQTFRHLMGAPTWDGVIVRVKSIVTDCVGDVDDDRGRCEGVAVQDAVLVLLRDWLWDREDVTESVLDWVCVRDAVLVCESDIAGTGTESTRKTWHPAGVGRD